ncbi:MAG TPA: acylphosphatase [Anaerolineales bacterium]
MVENETARLHATAEGHVQGVGFRYFVEDTAVALGLVGWVRNRWDGSVEVTAEGERQALEKLLAALYKGPRASVVTGVTSEWGASTGEFHQFIVRSTSG